MAFNVNFYQMKVSEAVLSRKSIRAFLKQRIPNTLIKELLIRASRSPSGGNLQPWRICVINEQSMQDFLDFQSSWEGEETPSYDIYPQILKSHIALLDINLANKCMNCLELPDTTKRLE